MVEAGPSAGERKATLRFRNGNEAARVRAAPSDTAEDLLAEVGLGDRGRPVIVVCGGANELDKRRGRRFRAAQVLGPAVVRTARKHHAAIVDGGTRSGVMRIVGEARDHERTGDDVLVGVAPRGRISEPDEHESSEPDEQNGTRLEPHHTHFVLADSARWGGETELLFQVADALSRDAPAVVVLLSGGTNSRGEMFEAVQRAWPIVVVRGFGGYSRTLLVADRLNRVLRRLGLARPAGWLTDRISPELRTTIESGKISFLAGGSQALERWIRWEVGDRPALKRVWWTFAAYDAQARLLQTIFRRSQMAIIALGIVATGIAAFYTSVVAAVDEQAAHLMATIVPALVALLIAVGGRRAFGKRWIFLRAAAESVKAETYRYRTRTGVYRAARSRDAVLAERVAAIRAQLLATDAAGGRLSFDRRAGPPASLYDEENLADLGATDYARGRTADQMRYYHRTVRRKIWRRNVLQFVTLVVGAAGSVIAALGGEPWVAVTTAVSAGAASYLATRQHEQDVLIYNQAAADLESTYDEWRAASGESVAEPAGGAAAAFGRLAKGRWKWRAAGTSKWPRTDEDPTERLVERTETILTDEVGAWARRMARVLEEEAKRQREHANGGGAEAG